MERYPACLCIVSFSYFLTYLTQLFFATQGQFLGLELARGTTIAAVIGQAAVDLKLEVKCELVLAHYHCHGRGSIIRPKNRKFNPVLLSLNASKKDSN